MVVISTGVLDISTSSLVSITDGVPTVVIRAGALEDGTIVKSVTSSTLVTCEDRIVAILVINTSVTFGVGDTKLDIMKVSNMVVVGIITSVTLGNTISLLEILRISVVKTGTMDVNITEVIGSSVTTEVAAMVDASSVTDGCGVATTKDDSGNSLVNTDENTGLDGTIVTAVVSTVPVNTLVIG